MGKKPKRKKGKDYRLETYFVGGKMKHRRAPLVEGMEVGDFYRAFADDSVLIADGYFDLLLEREENIKNTTDGDESDNLFEK